MFFKHKIVILIVLIPFSSFIASEMTFGSTLSLNLESTSNDRYIMFDGLNWKKEIRSDNSEVVILSDEYADKYNNAFWIINENSIEFGENGEISGVLLGLSLPIIANETYFKLTMNAKVTNDIDAGHYIFASLFKENNNSSYLDIDKNEVLAFSENWNNVSVVFTNLTKSDSYILMIYMRDVWNIDNNMKASFNNVILNYFNPEYHFEWKIKENYNDTSREVVWDNLTWIKEVRKRNLYNSLDLYDELQSHLNWTIIENEKLQVQEIKNVPEAYYGFSTGIVINDSQLRFTVSGKGIGNLVNNQILRFYIGVFRVRKDNSWFCEDLLKLENPFEWKTFNVTFKDLTVGGYYKLFIHTSDGFDFYGQGLQFGNFSIFETNPLNISDIISLSQDINNSFDKINHKSVSIQENSFTIISKQSGDLSIATSNKIVFSKDILENQEYLFSNSKNEKFLYLYFISSAGFQVIFIYDIFNNKISYVASDNLNDSLSIENSYSDNSSSVVTNTNSGISTSNGNINWDFIPSFFLIIFLFISLRYFQKKKIKRS